MSEYWKSNPKKYCEYCKVWITDNKATISTHESGKNHKTNVSAKLDEIKKNAVKKNAEDKKYNATMAAIEKAALSAMQKDLSSDSAVRHQYGKGQTASSSLPTETLSTQKKSVEKAKVAQVKKVAEPKAEKRKIDEPESKIGKWQRVEEKKVVAPKKPVVIDLQLPTSVPKTFQAIDPPQAENEPEEIVKNKWVPLGFNEVKSEDAEIKSEEQEKIEEIPVISTTIKEESVEIKLEEKMASSNEETTKPKKEKVIAFKKRKNDSQNLRGRLDQDD